MDPIITCNPWNPVAIKNVEPYEESAIENPPWLYSNNCNSVKYPPKTIVKIMEILAWLNLLLRILWWAQVIEIPDDSKTMVFNKGIFIGLKEEIINGGQLTPISILGEMEEWK